MKRERVCIVLDHESRRMVNAMARADGQSISAEIRLLIRRAHVDRMDKRRPVVQTQIDA